LHAHRGNDGNGSNGSNGSRGDHGHAHAGPAEEGRNSTFWALFVVFVLGPCEPLIPLLFLPASEGRWSLALWTTLVFGLVTIATMLALVAAASAGLALVPTTRLDRFAHTLAGAVIALSGLAILVLGV